MTDVVPEIGERGFAGTRRFPPRARVVFFGPVETQRRRYEQVDGFVRQEREQLIVDVERQLGLVVGRSAVDARDAVVGFVDDRGDGEAVLVELCVGHVFVGL